MLFYAVQVIPLPAKVQHLELSPCLAVTISELASCPVCLGYWRSNQLEALCKANRPEGIGLELS